MTGPGRARLHSKFLSRASDRDARRFAEYLKGAGLTLDRTREADFVHSTGATFVVLERLEFGRRGLSRHSRKLLDGFASVPEAEQMIEVISSIHDLRQAPQGPGLAAVEMQLLLNTDPVPILEELSSSHPELDLFLINPTPELIRRMDFWDRVFHSSERDLTAGEVEVGRIVGEIDMTPPWPGTAMGSPAHLVVAPMVARPDPMAAVLVTARMATLLFIPTAPLTRPPYIGEWPVGFPVGIAGLGVEQGMSFYQTTVGDVPKDLTSQMVVDLIERSNSMIEHLTDPAQWVDDAGVIDPLEQRIAWTTVEQGLGTVCDMARAWGSTEAIWVAFRALDILAGLWQGTDPSSFRLRELLNPKIIQTYAIDLLPWESYRQWATDITRNYADGLAEMYPDLNRKEQLDRLQQLRNLHHGTGVGSREWRGRRLEALTGVGRGPVQLLQDMATLWWTSVLLKPESHAVPGRPPFKIRK